MDSPFLDAVARGLGARGWAVARFEFPHMAARRADGRRRPPDRAPVLLDTWRAVASALGPPDRLVIGGKSMGGRMASLVADELGVAGLLCLGYPFHAAGRPERTRIAHLAELATPARIIQGTRDPLGRREEVEGYALSPSIGLAWIVDGDHDLKPRGSSGRTVEMALAEAIAAADGFARERAATG